MHERLSLTSPSSLLDNLNTMQHNLRNSAKGSNDAYDVLTSLTVSITTHTNLDVKQEKRIDDYWNIDGSRDLSDPWTGFTQFTLLEEKSSRRIYVVREEIDEKIAYIQARSSMARALEINGKAIQAEGEAKVVR